MANDERIPPNFGKLNKRRRQKKPTKRHLEDKLAALERKLEHWNKMSELRHHSELLCGIARKIALQIRKRMDEIFRQLETL